MSTKQHKNNEELKNLMQVHEPDSVRPVFFNQTVALDIDLAEELRKIIPEVKSNTDQNVAREGWVKLENVIQENSEDVPWLFSICTDGMGQYYMIRYFKENETREIHVFNEKGEKIKGFPVQDRIIDIAANTSGNLVGLDRTNKISCYNSDGILKNQFKIPIEPASFLQHPPYGIVAENSSEIVSGRYWLWPMRFHGKTQTVSHLDSSHIEFPNNGILGKHHAAPILGLPNGNGDYAEIPAIIEEENEYGEITEKQFQLSGEFTVSFTVVPSLREDLYSPNPKADKLSCTHNLFSSNYLGIGLILWKYVENNKTTYRSFFGLSVAGNGSYSSYALDFKPDREYQITVVRKATSFSLHIAGFDGELEKYTDTEPGTGKKNERTRRINTKFSHTGVCDFVKEIAVQNTYIGADILAANRWRENRFFNTKGDDFNSPEEIPHLPNNFFSGTIRGLKIIPTALSDKEINQILYPNQANFRMIAMSGNHIYTIEHQHKRLLAFDDNGELIQNGDIPDLTEEDDITAFCVDDFGNCYLIINEEYVLRYDAEGKWNKDWLSGVENISAISGIDAHASGLIFVSTRQNMLVCNINGEIRFTLKPDSNSLYIKRKISVSPSGIIHTDSKYAYRPQIGNQLVADLRGKKWYKTAELLATEVDYARTIHENQVSLYEEAKNNYQEDFGLLGDELQTFLERTQNTLAHFQAVEAEWEDFKDFLFSNGISTQGSEREVAQRVESYYREQQFLLQYMHNYLTENVENTEVRTYLEREGEYVDQYGMRLEQFVQRNALYPNPNISPVIIVPFDDNNMESGRVLIMIHPVYSGKKISPTNCIFKEEYKMDLSWLGITLGAYSHSINLLPGESRDIKATTKRTKKWETSYTSTSKNEQKRSGENERKVNQTNDFESKLHDELEKRRNSIDEKDFTNDSTSKSEMKFNMNLGIPAIGLGVKANARSETTRNINYNKHYKKNLDTVVKKVKDIVKNTSTKVSDQNKVSFSENSSSEVSYTRKDSGSQSETHAETVRIHNPNMGRTVNYHFFQLQNQYGTEIFTENAGLFFDTGIEIIQGTGITRQYSYTLESFTRLTNKLEGFGASDRQKIMDILSAFVLRKYLRIETEALEQQPRILVTEKREQSGFNSEELRELRDLIAVPVQEWRDNDVIREKLSEFRKMILTTKSVQVSTLDKFAVNSGHFFADSQVGANEAVEDYLIQRRNIETQNREAEVNKIKAQTEKGAFFEELPEGLTHLNYGEE